MIITTMDGVAGRMTETTLGAVRGTALWTKRIAKSCMGGIRHMQAFGLADLSLGLNEAKECASKELQHQARKLGADAVVGLRLEVIEMSNGVFCVNASGTAVRTVALPQSVPDFSMTGGGVDADDEALPLAAAPFVTVRPSCEGSLLRH